MRHGQWVGELTDYVRLNHNAVRQHLAVLKEAGLVIEETEQRDRPGRPSGCSPIPGRSFFSEEKLI